MEDIQPFSSSDLWWRAANIQPSNRDCLSMKGSQHSTFKSLLSAWIFCCCKQIRASSTVQKESLLTVDYMVAWCPNQFLPKFWAWKSSKQTSCCLNLSAAIVCCNPSSQTSKIRVVCTVVSFQFQMNKSCVLTLSKSNIGLPPNAGKKIRPKKISSLNSGLQFDCCCYYPNFTLVNSSCGYHRPPNLPQSYPKLHPKI